MSKKQTLKDIFDDDDFGILDSKEKVSGTKTEDERLIESFQEINAFFEKNKREPSVNNVTEFKLLSRLKSLRNDIKKIELLRDYDTFNLLRDKVVLPQLIFFLVGRMIVYLDVHLYVLPSFLLLAIELWLLLRSFEFYPHQ